MIGNRIKRRRQELGMTQKQLATQSGVLQQMISKLERGESHSTADIIPLAEALGVNPVWLATGKGSMQADAPSSAIGNIEPQPAIKMEMAITPVPLISWVQAGDWQEIVDIYHTGDGDEWIPVPMKVGENAFALRVKGDSMEPKFHDGDIIIIDPSVEVLPGDFAIVKLPSINEATFKQLIFDAGTYYLKPLNPQYRMFELPEDSIVCGKVVYRGEKF